MASRGSRILQGAQEALAFASGEADPASFAVRVPAPVDVKAIRSGLGMTQTAFAATFGLPVSKVQDWERGRSTPDEAGRAYLKVIQARPDAVKEALAKP